MFKHFKVSGEVEEVSDQEAGQRMDKISNQWEDESTNQGRLYMGVYDWDFTKSSNGISINIPNLRTGGSISRNNNASQTFGFDIFGDCFLKK